MCTCGFIQPHVHTINLYYKNILLNRFDKSILVINRYFNKRQIDQIMDQHIGNYTHVNTESCKFVLLQKYYIEPQIESCIVIHFL